MESKGADAEVVLLIAEERPVRLCRICHEEEDETSTSMEAPCACSGTLKFAHRGCVQRWCDEKGSTLCELCLQNFEPGYRVSPLKALVDIGVSIRERLDANREDSDQSNSDVDNDNGDSPDYTPDCSPPTSRGASLCRLVVIAFTFGLLLRHFFAVFALATNGCCIFSPFTVFMLRAVGILVPSLVLLMVITNVQKMQAQNRRRRLATAVDKMRDSQDDGQQSREDQLQLESIQTQ